MPYQPGIAALQQALAMPTTPVALNSGLVWGRRSFLKRPGTIIVEILPDIPAGLKRAEFMRRLEDTIETATTRLEAEAEAQAAPPS
jgi:1-acyl-sn-glycerol-3-phosphate acyltransferase